MQLTKAVKQEVIQKMMEKAVKKHAPAMVKAANSLDQLWRQVVTKHAVMAMPELPQERWAELIQEGALHRFSATNVTVNVAAPLERYPDRVEGRYVGEVRPAFGYKSEDEEKYREIVSAMDKAGWSRFLTLAGIGTKQYHLKVQWSLSFSDLPSFNWMAVVDTTGRVTGRGAAWSLDAVPLCEQAEDLTKKFRKVVTEAAEFYDSLQVIMESIRTDKQLLDQFPEAAKYLPEQAPKRQSVVPAELIAKARLIMETGIPN